MAERVSGEEPPEAVLRERARERLEHGDLRPDDAGCPRTANQSAHELECLLEIRKLELPPQVMLIDNLPSRHLGMEFLQFLAFERGHTPAARNALLIR